MATKVSRWVLYGHDRLYVEDDSGRLGYWDKKADRGHLEIGACVDTFVAALALYGVTVEPDQLLAQARAARASSAPAARRPSIATVSARDLARNRPGQALREKEAAERAAAPMRSTINRLLNVHTQERAWRLGAHGEEAVAARLDRLGPEWRVVHGIVTSESGTDIDHLVVGPGGVFTVNAKHHPSAAVWVASDIFLVNGRRAPYVRASRSEARKASRVLSRAIGHPVQVRGIIAVMGATKGFTVKEQPRDGAVVVVPRREIDGWLLRQPRVLSATAAQRVFDAARQSNTWPHARS